MKYFKILFLIIVALGVQGVYALQLEIPPKPKTATSVYDTAQLLSREEAIMLTQKLIRYADTTSTQIVVATIPSLQGEDIALYATRWAHAWGIGQKEKDNGVFLLIAKNDRKLWIATGYGVEEKLTDYTSKQIIDQIITPAFKNGNFYQGIDRGTSAIIEVLAGTFEGTPVRNPVKLPIDIDTLIYIVAVLIVIILSFIKRNNSGPDDRGGGGYRSIIFSGSGRESGGGSFDGGFGGGFGGGGFGGGGAGGSW